MVLERFSKSRMGSGWEEEAIERYCIEAAGPDASLTALGGESSSVIDVRDTSGGVTFAVKVQPRARKNAITGELEGTLKLALTAPPVEGKANEACIEFLAKLLKVPRSSVTIASGLTSRRKVVRVGGLSTTQLKERLGT
jgi:uncharacterized protein (TIGR00251 family)